MTVIMPDANLFNNQGFLLVILLVVILQLRQRRVRSWTLMIMPALLSLITIPLVISELYSAFNIIILVISFIAGIAIGILIGKFMEVKIDENGSMILKGSFIAVLLWIATILLKLYGKDVLVGTRLIELNLLTSAFLVMTLGGMISRRVFIYWKYLQFRKERNISNA
ncbi:MAG: DUF1453 domain-containing protein [Methanobacterium sp.]